MALDGQNYASGWLLHSFLRVVEGLLKEKARKVVVGGSRSSCLFSTVFMMNKDVSLVSNEMLGTILQILNNHYCSLFSFSSFYHVSEQLFLRQVEQISPNQAATADCCALYLHCQTLLCKVLFAILDLINSLEPI